MKYFLIIASLLMMSVSAHAQTIIKQQDPTPLLVNLSSLGNKSLSMNVGMTTTVTAAPNNIVAAHTVGASNVYYINYVSLGALVHGVTLTVATDLGDISLESPAGTKLLTAHMAAYQGKADTANFSFAEPIPIPAGQLVRVVADPAASASATSVDWHANFGGYER